MTKALSMLLLLTVMAGCGNKKQQREQPLPYGQEEAAAEAERESDQDDWGVESDTLHFKDGMVIHWHEQHKRSPFHQLREVFHPDGKILVQTAMQYGRALDQVLLYEYDKKERLACIHNYPSGIAATEERDAEDFKHAVDSLLKLKVRPVGTDEWDYVDYRFTYGEQGQPVSLHSEMLGKKIDRDTFGPSGKYEVKVLQNTAFWESDLHGGNLIVCQMWGSPDGSTEHYTGCRALAVNLKKIWCKEYADGQLVKTSFFHRLNSENEEKVHSIERQVRPDGSTLYLITDKDNMTTEYVWKNGVPIHSTRQSRYGTVLYQTTYSVDGTDIVIHESVYNYRTKQLEERPPRHEPLSGYREHEVMDVAEMIGDEYDRDYLPTGQWDE